MWEFKNNFPIFQQIAEKIKLDIICGKYKAGDWLPGVRELAIEAGANPNTVQKAYVELENEGYVDTKRGEGRIVHDDNEWIICKANEYIQKQVEDFVSQLEKAGFSKNDIINCIKNLMGE